MGSVANGSRIWHFSHCGRAVSAVDEYFVGNSLDGFDVVGNTMACGVDLGRNLVPSFADHTSRHPNVVGVAAFRDQAREPPEKALAWGMNLRQTALCCGQMVPAISEKCETRSMECRVMMKNAGRMPQKE